MQFGLSLHLRHKMLAQTAMTRTLLLEYARVTQSKQNIEVTSKKTEFVIVELI